MAFEESNLPIKRFNLDSHVTDDGSLERQAVFKIRSYQLEMLEESMKRNIIVAAETGSGKTFIAILRIQAELEQCPPEKLVWFCVPTVALAIQQHKAISTQLPAFQARVLSGADNVDLWTDQWIWDGVLQGIRIVVSTHQILLEALVHGFVRMQQLALMVFDEAHSCIGDHPSSRILRDFYHQTKTEERPAILGLTASPVVNSKVGKLDILETNLNAISRTPKLHREELLQYVHQPELIPLMYPPNILEVPGSLALESLRNLYEGFDIEQDPWVIKMRSDRTMCGSKVLAKALISQKTYCRDQIKSLYDKAKAIRSELGESATDYYIQECIQKVQKGADDGSFALEGLESEEKTYLRKRLSEVQVSVPKSLLGESCRLSPKVRILINFLNRQGSGAASFSGLIFVRTRADVAVLSQLLSFHSPAFAVSTFVGASSFSGRKNTIGELADIKNQKDTLDDLRYGRKNLIVTTNALEEGIDVSTCSVVICFDKPPNLKSFIQRRGRARKSNSKYVLMFENGPESGVVYSWTALEAEMRKLYEDDLRQVQELQKLEALENEDSEERTLTVNSTGANLTLSDAVQHLYHFCATLPAASHADLNPIFTFQGHSPDPNTRSILATVLLPNSIDASVRQACGISRWRTEKMARRDAAFEAYKALYKAGLVNDNLLPLGHIDEGVEDAYAAVEKRPSLVELSDQSNPWIHVAQEWQQSTTLQASTITIAEIAEMRTEMMLLLPFELPNIEDIILYWDRDTPLRVSFTDARRLDPRVKPSAAKITSLLFRSIYRGKMGDDDDFTTLFLPCNIDDFGTWHHNHTGVIGALDLCEDDVGEDAGIIRDTQNGVPHIFRKVVYASAGDILNSGSVNACQDRMMGKVPSIMKINNNMDVDQDDIPGTSVLLEVTKLPKKMDFLHKSPGQDARVVKESKPRMLLAERCEMDRLPLKYAYFAMFVPSILHRIKVTLVVDSLCNGLLSPLEFKNRNLVTTAISTSSANEATDYQRQEFLGDSYLKFLTSLTLMARHLNYHEGILSHKKDHIVSNSSLASAAIKKGLDQYILTKAFTGNKWRPLYNSQIIKTQSAGKREMSSKTLADVVEALVGAAFLDGGQGKSLACLSIFLPDVPWLTPSDGCQTLYEVYDKGMLPTTSLAQLENLINYQANLKLLLMEALTHPSHRSPNGCASYERLEYLGDAILDSIVTTIAFAHDPPIPTHRLHLLRTALVNGHFLGFLCLSLCVSLPHSNPLVDSSDKVSIVEVSHPFYLWQAMRHASPTITRDQQSCLKRYAILKDTLEGLLTHGTYYPWTALAQLEPPKFMSDMVESLLGAIYIDSHGSMSACESFLEHLGLISYLRRVITTDIALLHPKEELGQLANQDKVKYELGREGEEGRQTLTCKVLVGDREVVSVGDGRVAMEVQTKAADAACRILRKEGTKPQDGSVDDCVGVEIGSERGEGSEEDPGARGSEYDSDVYMTADE